jgi:hypothetical protein
LNPESISICAGCLELRHNGLNKRLGGIYYLLLKFALIICNKIRLLKT